MDKLIEKWKSKLSVFGKYIEYHLIEGEASGHHLREKYNEDIYYALLHFKENTINLDQIEKSVGYKFPQDLKDVLKENLFRLEDDYGNFYTGLSSNISNLVDHIQIENVPDNSYSKDEIYLIQHGFSIGKSHSSDDSRIFLAYNKLGEPMLGEHGHDGFINHLEPYTLTTLIKFLDNDMEEFLECIIEGFEDDEIDFDE